MTTRLVNWLEENDLEVSQASLCGKLGYALLDSKDGAFVEYRWCDFVKYHDPNFMGHGKYDRVDTNGETWQPKGGDNSFVFVRYSRWPFEWLNAKRANKRFTNWLKYFVICGFEYKRVEASPNEKVIAEETGLLKFERHHRLVRGYRG